MVVMWGPGLVGALLVTGCFAKPGAPGGTSGDDAGADAPYATTFGAFGAAVRVTGVEPDPPLPGGDDAPTISKFATELFFSSERNSPPSRMYRLTDPNPTGFDTREFFGPLGDIEADGTITIAGLDMYSFDGSYNLSHWKRSAYGVAWQRAATDLPLGLGPFDFGADDLRVIGGSTRNPLDPASTLVEYQRATTSSGWTASPPLGFALESTAAGLSRDGFELFYEQHGTKTQIWHTQRATLDAAFDPPVQLMIPGVDMVNDNYGDPELTVDGTRLYFDVLIGADFKLFFADRQPLP